MRLDSNIESKSSNYFSALKKSCFFKSMLLPNFAFNVIYTENKKIIISMMFKQVLFDDFELMLLQKLKKTLKNDVSTF